MEGIFERISQWTGRWRSQLPARDTIIGKESLRTPPTNQQGMVTMEYKIDESNLISTQEWSTEIIKHVLKLGRDIKERPGRYHDALKRKSLCMYFFNPSLRTRNSFEVGINQMGGHGVFIDAKTSWLGQGSESVKDTASVLSRYHDLIAIRMFPNIVNWEWMKCNTQLRAFAKYSSVPVINMEDDLFHPCQGLTDAFTIKERLKRFQGRKIAITWAYHPKPLPMAVPDSILLISTRLGMDVTFTRPDANFDLDDGIMELAEKNAKISGGTFEISSNMLEACEGADVVYVKSWGSKNFYGDPRPEKKLRIQYRTPANNWMLDERKMDATGKEAIFMHCLPVRRNIVVTDEVMDGEKSVVYDQAENRMHVQKAIMKFLGDQDS
ncbi:N-acetylornithine carbamoyltransferase [Candidatus Bathyarchaeota archaeon]|nr:N-acetylornithine carbamoyltransferase [Candidatus Bathyarchaeota archaeon]